MCCGSWRAKGPFGSRPLGHLANTIPRDDRRVRCEVLRADDVKFDVVETATDVIYLGRYGTAAYTERCRPFVKKHFPREIVTAVLSKYENDIVQFHRTIDLVGSRRRF